MPVSRERAAAGPPSGTVSSTNYAGRDNLTTRMTTRRSARNHALALYFACYHFIFIHKWLRPPIAALAAKLRYWEAGLDEPKKQEILQEKTRNCGVSDIAIFEHAD